MIAVQSLTKRFGSTIAVDDLSFEVRPGTVLGFLGPNGAGKTTTLRALLGLAAPSAGFATIDGRRYRDLQEPIRTVGAMLEGVAFHPGRSARNHLRALSVAAGIPATRAAEVLQLVGLAEVADKRVKTYSLGMRQRLALAAALLGDPAVLVLDEPANGLDPLGIRWLRDFLRAQAADGRTVLVSSHVLSEMAQTADEVVVIDHGRLIADATVAELTRRAGAAVRVRSPDAARLAELLAAANLAAESAGPERLTVRGAPSSAIGQIAAEHGIAIHEMTDEARTLEDVFLELTGPPGGRPQ